MCFVCDTLPAVVQFETKTNRPNQNWSRQGLIALQLESMFKTLHTEKEVRQEMKKKQ